MAAPRHKLEPDALPAGTVLIPLHGGAQRAQSFPAHPRRAQLAFVLGFALIDRVQRTLQGRGLLQVRREQKNIAQQDLWAPADGPHVDLAFGNQASNAGCQDGFEFVPLGCAFESPEDPLKLVFPVGKSREADSLKPIAKRLKIGVLPVQPISEQAARRRELIVFRVLGGSEPAAHLGVILERRTKQARGAEAFRLAQESPVRFDGDLQPAAKLHRDFTQGLDVPAPVFLVLVNGNPTLIALDQFAQLRLAEVAPFSDELHLSGYVFIREAFGVSFAIFTAIVELLGQPTFKIAHAALAISLRRVLGQ